MTRDRGFEDGAVARAGDMIENDSGDRHGGIVANEAGDERGDRGALPFASATSTTGHPVSRASSAVEPVSPSGPVPSKRPMTPSHTTISAALSSPPTSPASVAGRIAQGSRLRHGTPLARA